MIVESMSLRFIKKDKHLVITLTSKEGESVEVRFGTKKARQLMRAIFLQVGLDPRLDKNDTYILPGREE